MISTRTSLRSSFLILMGKHGKLNWNEYWEVSYLDHICKLESVFGERRVQLILQKLEFSTLWLKTQNCTLHWKGNSMYRASKRPILAGLPNSWRHKKTAILLLSDKFLTVAIFINLSCQWLVLTNLHVYKNLQSVASKPGFVLSIRNGIWQHIQGGPPTC